MKIRFWEKIRRWSKKKENILIEFSGMLFSVIILVVALFLYLSGLLDILTLLGVVFGLLLVFLQSYVHLIKKRERTISWINLASGYLLGEKVSKIGKFFDKVKLKCQIGDDFETKRKIVETLPDLFEIDFEESKELKEILRRDWDDTWRSDNRRRTIESLSYIINKDKKLVRDNLHIIDRDEIFTIMAIVEVLDVWRKEVDKKEAERLFVELKSEMQEYKYGQDEINGVSELWDILYLIRSDINRAIKRFEELKDNPNIYIQICIARNLKHLCKRFPERMINLMTYFVKEDKHRYVRRPIAKEDSVECLIGLLRDRKHFEKAKGIIWKLTIDEDDIIGITTFDKIEKILDIDSNFGKEILQHIVKHNHHPRLVERANVLLKRDKR